MVHQIEFVLDWVVLILSLAVFIVFYMNVGKFVPGEGKKIFTLITVFLGLNFITFLVIDVWGILHFLTMQKWPASSETEESIKAIGHILQILGLGVLIYISMIFKRFAKKLEKARGD